VLSTLAREASLEVEEIDPSKAFPAKDDETFPAEGEKKGFEEEPKPEHHSLRAAIKETAIGGYESLKEKAQNTVDWLKEKVGAPLKKDAEFHADDIQEKAGELKEKAGELKEKAQEKLEETAESLKEGDAHASIGQRIKDKIAGGMEMAKEKAHDAAQWVQSKVGMGEEAVKEVQETGSPGKATAEERKEGTFEKAQNINK